MTTQMPATFPPYSFPHQPYRSLLDEHGKKKKKNSLNGA